MTYYGYQERVNWSDRLDEFGRALITRLGHDPDFLPTDHNPITRALQQDGFIEGIQDMEGFFTRGVVSRCYRVSDGPIRRPGWPGGRRKT